MNHDRSEGWIEPSPRREGKPGRGPSIPYPMTLLSRLVKQPVSVLFFVIFANYVAISVNGFLCSRVSNPTAGQKPDRKSTVCQAKCDRDHGRRESIDLNDGKQTDRCTQNQEKTVLARENVQHLEDKSLKYRDQTKHLFDRRKMAAVATGRTLAMVFGGSLSSAAFTESFLSLAVATDHLALTEENRGDVLSISSDEKMSMPTLPADDPVELPLEYIPTLGAYVVRYFLFGEAFAAIVDTGSPFLTVPCYCKPYRNRKMFWGCYKPELTRDSGYENTIEGFDNNYGTVVWRKADFSFSPADNNESYTTTFAASTDVVFGVLDKDLLNGSGGVFFGLIKETDRWIRPSFLGQTGYKSFCVDLRHNNGTNILEKNTETSDQGTDITPRLVLSTNSMIGTPMWRRKNEKTTETDDWIPLVRDLKKKYGAPVVHYTAKASSFVVNGLPLLINKKKPLYVIFDTGVSGMVVSQELFDGRYLQARKNREKSLWGTVEVSFATNTGKTVTLSATKPITTPLGKATPWKGFKGNLIAVGLAFLDGFATTVDVDDGKILFVEG